MSKSPRRKPKSTRNWKTHFTAKDRQYDPKVDGWNTHHLRQQPTAEDLIALEQERMHGLDEF